MPPETLQVVALGLIQGATELLPVSSSAHIAALPQLLRWSVGSWEPERRKELEVALHAGALLALAPALWRVRPDLRTLALSLVPPVVVGYGLERPIERRLGGPAGLASGLILGAVALAAADRAGGAPASSRGAIPSPGTPPRDALVLGLAQAAALWPGVSRTGATLAAARALGYDRADASRLSFGVAGPVLAGATALKAWRGRKDADLRLVATGAGAAFAGTAAALRVLGLERRRPFAVYAAERVVLASAILGLRYRRAR
jgi:undecaprenyl-diphosphatase